MRLHERRQAILQSFTISYAVKAQMWHLAFKDQPGRWLSHCKPRPHNEKFLSKIGHHWLRKKASRLRLIWDRSEQYIVAVTSSSK